MHWIKNSSEAFAVRYDLLKKFFEDHFAERYHASIPLGLIIIDDAVNDFTKRQGFFADGTTVDAWDCLVGCSDGLTKLKSIFTKMVDYLKKALIYGHIVISLEKQRAE